MALRLQKTNSRKSANLLIFLNKEMNAFVFQGKTLKFLQIDF